MREPDYQSADRADNYLRRLFDEGEREIADEGFTEKVMAGVARGQVLRLGVFALALLAAAGVVATQLITPSAELFALLSQSMASARIPDMTPTRLTIISAALAAVLTPVATHMLED